MRSKIFYIVFLSLLLVSCASSKIAVDKNFLPYDLGIHLTNNAGLTEGDYIFFVDATNEFIDAYNIEQHDLKLHYAQVDNSSLNINLVSNTYVTSKQQALGVVVTVLGFATFAATMAIPEVPFYLIFWYNPHNKTVINVSFAENIDPSMKQYVRTISTRHKFQNLEKQKEKQKVAYYNMLGVIMEEIEGTSNSKR